MKTCRKALFVLTLTISVALWSAAQDQPASAGSAQQLSPAASGPAGATAAPPSATRKVTAYTLPPELYKKARDRSRIHFRLALISFAYGLIVLWAILHWKLGSKYRDWAEKAFAKRFRISNKNWD